ncbi:MULTISPECIES: hypothetical protein [Bacteria]|uniref:hypothetical protein n=1 Tax=Bacteria TaxID=2 RepID=UPI002FCC0426
MRDDFFYPDKFEYKGITYKGQRSSNKLLILIDNEDCPFDIGGVVIQKVGSKERAFKVTEWEVQTSLGIGGKPFLADLAVISLDAIPKENPSGQTINFHGSVTAENLQAGNNNSLTQQISIEQLAKAINESNDPEAKGLLQKLLDNKTVAGILAATVGGLFKF